MTLNPLIEPNWYYAIMPELVLAAGGMLLILLDAIFPRLRNAFAGLTAVILIGTAIAEFSLPLGTYFGGTYEVSALTRLFDMTFLLAALLASMVAREYLEREGLQSGEFYALLMWGTIGMMMMGKGLDLLLVVLGLEMLSICIFVLVGYHRRASISNEASLKYFLMGAFATGFILYGTALFYGATESTNLARIAEYSANNSPNALLTIAFVMLMGGFGFKLALAPFHGWAPDVYQGAPTPVAGWISVAPKAATLIALIRILSSMFHLSEVGHWSGIVAILSIASMIVGNLVAISQRDLKRLLAYSGIAHVGYMAIALLTIREDSVAAIGIYTLTYALMNIGAFGVISLLQKNQNEPQTLDDIAGLGFRRPFYGLALAICMFSLSGLPPTAGFIAKFAIFKAAVDAGHIGIALVGILTSILSVYYYLRVVYFLYMKEGDQTVPAVYGGFLANGALVISMVGIFAIGIFPMLIFATATQAAQLFMHR